MNFSRLKKESHSGEVSSGVNSTGSESGMSGLFSLDTTSNGPPPVPVLFEFVQNHKWRKLKRALRKKKGARLCSERDSSGLYLLGIALGYGAPLDIIRLIVSVDPAQLNAVDNFGANALHIGCLNGAPFDIIKYVLRNGTGNLISDPDSDNRVPLHHAVECLCRNEIDFSEGVKVIVSLCEVSPTLIHHQDQRGDTPIDLVQIASQTIPSEGDTSYGQRLRWLYGFLREISIQVYKRRKSAWEEAGHEKVCRSDEAYTSSGERDDEELRHFGKKIKNKSVGTGTTAVDSMTLSEEL